MSLNNSTEIVSTFSIFKLQYIKCYHRIICYFKPSGGRMLPKTIFLLERGRQETCNKGNHTKVCLIWFTYYPPGALQTVFLYGTGFKLFIKLCLCVPPLHRTCTSHESDCWTWAEWSSGGLLTSQGYLQN